MSRFESHPELPLDPDLEYLGPGRPDHLELRHVLAVAGGGFLGCAARYGVVSAWTVSAAAFPLPVFAVNVAGAFVLGALLETIARRGPDAGLRRTLRLLCGTGFCGGFTTYSTLAMGTFLLLRGRHLALALGYVIASVAAGLAAATIGILVASARHRRQELVAVPAVAREARR